MAATAHSPFALILRACATAIGLAGFAILFSYAISEVYSLVSGAEPVALQTLSFLTLQLAFVTFVLWVRRPIVPVTGLNPSLVLLSFAIGAGTAVYFSADLQMLLGIAAAHAPVNKLAPSQLVFGSAPAHAAAFLLQTALLAPLAENLIYRELIFREAGPADIWAISAGSLLTFTLAYGFNLGFQGMAFALQFGLALTLLRVLSRSVMYPILAHMAYGLCVETAALVRHLP